MSEVKAEQNDRKEEQSKGTNWYLIAGVAAAVGVAAVATVVVVQNGRRKKTQLFVDEDGYEDEIVWTEDTQYMANFMAATKKTFSYMWNRTISGVKLVDKSIRGYIDQPISTSPLASQKEVQASQQKMLRNDDDEDLFVDNF